jgi:hypothetical protein
MGDHSNETTPYVHHVSKITGYPPANPEAPHQLEVPMLVPWPSMLNSWRDLAGSTSSMPLPHSPSTVNESLHPSDNSRKRKQPVIGAPNLRRLAPKATQGALGLGSSQSRSDTLGTKHSKPESTWAHGGEPVNYLKSQTRNGIDIETDSTSYSSVTRTLDSGPQLACKPHKPPDLFQAYSALCVVVDFFAQQPPGCLEHRDAVTLGALKERLNAKRRATQHSERKQG